MLRRAGHLLRVLALGTLAVPVYALKFNFTDVQQCEPVTMTFSGSDTKTPPTFLTIIPLDSIAIVVPLQNPDLVSTGIAISFLPLDAGSNFLASLDDEEGDSLIPISDLIRVLPSPTQNSSCLPNPESVAPRHFTIDDTVSQCEDFSIVYDTNAVFKAPSVRLFNPRGVSFLLNITSDDPESGIATYTMNFMRGNEIVLLIDNGASIRETSSLLTVGGDSSSSTSCIKHNNGNSTNNTTSTASASKSTPLASKAILIGSIAGGSAVLLIALSMIIFVIRDRRRRRRPQPIQFDPSAMEKAADSNDNEKGNSENMDVTPRPLKPSATGTGAVSNPIYTTNSFLSTGISSSKPRGSMASWAQVIPQDQRYRSSTRTRSLVAMSPTARLTELDNADIVVVPPDSESPTRPDRPSLETLDIEGMLNMASVQSAASIAGSRKNSDVTPFGPMLRTSSLTVPTPTYARNPTGRRHLRDPSDVPAGPDSMLFSGYSVNPFDSQDSSFQEPLRTGDSLRSPGGAGLPSSPRVILTEDRARMSSGSERSSSDWYGIAR